MEDKEKQIIFNTVKTTVELMTKNYSFRKYLEVLGLDKSDYENLYNAGGMVLVDISSVLDEIGVGTW